MFSYSADIKGSFGVIKIPTTVQGLASRHGSSSSTYAGLIALDNQNHKTLVFYSLSCKVIDTCCSSHLVSGGDSITIH